MKTGLLIGISASLRSFGSILQAQDADTTGKDDVLGSILSAGADALQAWAFGNEKGWRKALTAIRDTCNSVLGSTAPTA